MTPLLIIPAVIAWLIFGSAVVGVAVRWFEAPTDDLAFTVGAVILWPATVFICVLMSTLVACMWTYEKVSGKS